MPLGDNIKKARILNNLSQKELAMAISTESEKVGNTTISNWENNINKPDADTIALLCKVLNVDANYLLDFDEQANYQEDYKKNSDSNNKLDELDLLWKKYKYFLTEDDEATMKFIFENRKRKIDEQKKSN